MSIKASLQLLLIVINRSLQIPLLLLIPASNTSFTAYLPESESARGKCIGLQASCTRGRAPTLTDFRSNIHDGTDAFRGIHALLLSISSLQAILVLHIVTDDATASAQIGRAHV